MEEPARSHTHLYALGASVAPYVIAASVIERDLPASRVLGVALMFVSFASPIGAVVLAIRALRQRGTAFARGSAVAALALAIPFVVCFGLYVVLALRRNLAT